MLSKPYLLRQVTVSIDFCVAFWWSSAQASLWQMVTVTVATLHPHLLWSLVFPIHWPCLYCLAGLTLIKKQIPASYWRCDWLDTQMPCHESNKRHEPRTNIARVCLTCCIKSIQFVCICQSDAGLHNKTEQTCLTCFHHLHPFCVTAFYFNCLTETTVVRLQ